MSVAAVTSFPEFFVAGDAVRVTIANLLYPSSLWTLSVIFQDQNSVTVQPFAATSGANNGYDLAITSAQSAAIPAGHYLIAYVFTEIALPNDRKTVDCEFHVQVYANPAVATEKSLARQTLDAMNAAYLLLFSGGAQSVNFNGQSFTKLNMQELNDQIREQTAIVAAEDADRLGHRRIARILHPL